MGKKGTFCYTYKKIDGKISIVHKGEEVVTNIPEKEIGKVIDELEESAKEAGVSVERYLDDLVDDINGFKIVSISDKNKALIDSNKFIRSFSDDFIKNYKKLITHLKRREIIEKGKKALKNDPKKKHLRYDNTKTPNVPYSKNGVSPTFKGMRAYIQKGEFGNGIIPKGAEKFVKDMRKIIEKHKGEIRTFVTGNRASDFKNCWRAMGVTDEKLINKYQRICNEMELTWHHLDDLDNNLKSTFQLVFTKLHDDTLKHMGSHAELKEVFNQLKKY